MRRLPFRRAEFRQATKDITKRRVGGIIGAVESAGKIANKEEREEFSGMALDGTRRIVRELKPTETTSSSSGDYQRSTLTSHNVKIPKNHVLIKERRERIAARKASNAKRLAGSSNAVGSRKSPRRVLGDIKNTTVATASRKTSSIHTKPEATVRSDAKPDGSAAGAVLTIKAQEYSLTQIVTILCTSRPWLKMYGDSGMPHSVGTPGYLAAAHEVISLMRHYAPSNQDLDPNELISGCIWIVANEPRRTPLGPPSSSVRQAIDLYVSTPSTFPSWTAANHPSSDAESDSEPESDDDCFNSPCGCAARALKGDSKNYCVKQHRLFRLMANHHKIREIRVGDINPDTMEADLFNYLTPEMFEALKSAAESLDENPFSENADKQGTCDVDHLIGRLQEICNSLYATMPCAHTTNQCLSVSRQLVDDWCYGLSVVEYNGGNGEA